MNSLWKSQILPIMTKIKSGLVIALLGLSTATLAQDLSVPVSKQSQATIEKPTLGQSMVKVEERFGQPLERTAAVGEPPITRWRYAKFTVYFEHDKVIHSVTHRS